MWASFVLSFLVVQIFLSVKNFWKTSKNKPDYEESKQRTIPELSGLGVLAEFLKAATIYSNTPGYDVAYKAAKKLGPLSVIRFSKLWPFHPRVVVNCMDLDTAKKVMTSPKWSDRFPTNHYLFTCSFNKPLGLLSGGGEYYKRARQLFLKLLHNFGFFSPTRMEGLVSFEMADVESNLTQRIDAAGGELTFTPHEMFQVSTLNMVWLMLCGQRCSSSELLVHKMIDCINETNRKFCAPYTILEFIPFLKNFPSLTMLEPWQGACEFLYGTFKDVIAEKRKEPLEERLKRPPTDLVDGFVQQIDKLGGKDEYLTDENLMVAMRDMVFGGSDTTNSALEFGLLYVSLYPNIQRKVQEEIDLIIGPNRAPLYADKLRMKFTHAVMLETLRLASSVPGMLRAAVEDTEIHGVKFLKDTIFGINFYGLHRNEQIWEEPEAFRPERFLDENQNLINQDKIMPFGYGKRSCMGETVALVTFFIFFVTLLQKFEFQISPDHPAPSFKNVVGISRSPLPYYLRVRKRAV